jgi:hypothetical protein
LHAPAAHGQAGQELEGAGGMASRSPAALSTVPSQKASAAAVQQPADAGDTALGRAHEGGLHLDGDHAARVGAFLGLARHARGMRHGHVEQRHHHAAVRHVPGVVQLIADVQAISLSPSSKRNSSAPSRWMKGMCARTASRLNRLRARADAAVHRQDLPGDVLARRRGEEQRRALQVVVVADALERRLRGQLVGAELRRSRPWSSCSGRSPAPAR